MVLEAATGRLFRQKILLLTFVAMTVVCGIHDIGYAQLPSFSDTEVSRSVAENSPAGTDIGDPVTADDFNSSTDRYRLAGPGDNADSPDSDSFEIDSTTSQLTTNSELDYETKNTYTVVVIVERQQGGSWVEATSDSRSTVTINVTNVFEYEPLSERTQQVVDEIVSKAPVSTADAVTEAHLRAINWILINNKSISALKEKDFEGLTSMTALWLNSNDLTSLPENVFSGLPSLQQILLQYNRLASLPKNAFKNLYSLTTLRLEGNKLTSLPDGAFSGLTRLTKLHLNDNTANPVPLTISFVKIAEGEFKAVVPSGAPFRMVLHLDVENGTVDDGATTLTVAAGAVESNNSLTVTRIPGTTHAVTVDYADPLPSLPSDHKGYALTRSTDLPLSIIAKLNSPPVFSEDVDATPTIAENSMTNVDIGTPLTAIDVDDDAVTYSLIAHADDADDYLAFTISSTTGQLKTKDSLDHETQSTYKVTVKASDVHGASNTLDVTITLLDLYEYTLMSDRTQQVVDEIVFRAPVSTASAVTEDHLEAITQLILNNELISSLKENDFEGLRSMQALWLNSNDLTSLPDNIFDGLCSLDTILLNDNALGSLDADVFSGLSSLKKLRLEGIQLTSLPATIFNGLSKLEEIHLNRNQLSSLPDGVFSGLTGLKQLYMNRNTVNPLPVTVSLVKVAEGQFKAVAPTGAPFRMVLHLTVTNGSIDGGATSATIPQGSVESRILTVTRTPYTAAAVTVDIRNPLPRLPETHQGYAIRKSADLPVTVIAEIPNNTPVFNTGLNTTPSIAENTAAGTNIGTPLTATDADSTDTLTYSLKAHAEDTDDYLAFTIDSMGQLKTEDPLDYETQATYKVTVAVTDNVVITTIDVTITITNVNEAPAFPPSQTGAHSIPDNIAAEVNIGAAMAAVDPDLTSTNTDANPETSAADTLTYSLSGDDAASFNIDTTTGQLQTKTGVTFDAAIKDTYNVTVTATDGALSASINVTITVVEAAQFNYAPIFNTGLNTTPSIAEHTAADTNIGTPLTATDVDTEDRLTYSLKAHADDTDDYLAFAIDNMGQLKTKANLDFEVQSTYKITVEVSDGTATATIDVTITITNIFEYTPLSERTQQVVDEIVREAPVLTASAVTERHLEAIRKLLVNNENITALKEKDFEGLSSLGALWLYSNDLTSLPENVFSGLSNLTQLLLQYNQLTSLPENIFRGLSSLTTLRLEGNRLSSLPPNLFAGHTKLTKLILRGNTVSPLPLTISFVKVAEGEFKAVVPSGAPFRMVLPLSVVNGTVDGGATTLTVPAGAVESSNSLTVTRIPGTTHAVTVDFGESLPSLPSNHEGYALTKSAELPLAVIPALNSPPVFNEDANTMPTIAENTAAGENIGTPLTATDIDNDTVIYRLKAHADDVDDYLAFSIDSMGQLKTKDPLNHEVQRRYRVTVEASDGKGGTANLDVTIILLDLFEYTLLSDRTQQVVDEIVFRAPVSTASAVTEDHLEAIPFLLLNHESITALKEKDFEGLSSVSDIRLNHNDLTSLPANIFNGLSRLQTLILNYNNQLSSLDANIFNGLSSLKKLRLEGLRLTSLPSDIFNGLSRLQELHLNYNRLSTLPDGVFSGLTSLTHLYMVGNTVSSLPLPVSLVKTGAGQFKAVAPTGAPFRMVLRLTGTNGSIDGGATSVVIAQGSVESNILTVTRTAGTTDAVTVDIGTPLPSLPASHQGYSIKKSSDLPLTVIDATETSPPVFNTGLNTTPEVVENTAADTNIGTPLTATDADTGDMLTYVLMAHSGDADDYLSFAIDENTGQLKIKDPLDYETQSTYKVMVQVSDGIFTTTIDVTITVTDVNEAPTFPADTDTRDVAENTMAGVNIGDPVAANEPDTADGDTDVNPDDPKVDALTYSLSGTDAASFGIDTGTGQLKTKAALDYETKDDYEVTVTVSDGGTDTATVRVTINIIDVDDTPPTVEITGAITAQKDKFGITFTFSEPVSGFDDAATDISLTTTLTEGTGNATINKFTPVTGSDTQYTAEITPPTNADGSVAIQVPAGAVQDAAANGNTASSIFTVPMDTIIPSVTITAPMAKMGAFSVTITFSEDVTDFDNLLTDLTLSDRAEATVTSLTGSGTTYTANIAPTSHGNLKITIPKNAAKDKATNGNAASRTHTVAIGLTGPSVAIQGVPTDPQNSAFTVTIIFSASVTGFTQSDISLGTGVSAMVTSFTGSGTEYTAEITPANNVEEEITLSVPADAAQNDANMGNTASSEYPIGLDKVQPSVTVTAPATAVTVFDVTITFSENVTDFVQGDISFTGSTATAAVTDFTVENAKEYTAAITPTSNGDVMISVPTGVATDAAENQNTVSDISTVTVELNNAPAFDTGLNITPTVAENTAAGTNIGAPLTATDADTGATLTYSLKAHSDDADDYLAFAIDEDTGQLKTEDPLDHETQSSYKIMVEVSDSIATAALNVIIIVTNVNEAPMFASETLNLTVSRRAAVGAIVETVAAADPDTDDTLTYSLSGTDASSFTIDNMDNLGQLSVKSALTAEIGDEYMVTITVSDGGTLTDTVDVTITATMVPVCDRTQQVQDAIVAAVSGVTDCNDVTEMHLAAIMSLSLFNKGITALKIGDFDGLTAMTDITLQLNELTSLPVKVFKGLTVLTNLNLAGNKITTLPANVFAELSALTHLNLSHNELQTPSAGVFNGLMALEVLYLNNLHTSQTVTLPASLFNGLTALKTLTLDNNQLETLPSTVFSGLTSLESLTLNNNELPRLPRNVFNGLTALEAIDLYNNDLTELPSDVFSGLSSLATLYLYEGCA